MLIPSGPSCTPSATRRRPIASVFTACPTSRFVAVPVFRARACEVPTKSDPTPSACGLCFFYLLGFSFLGVVANIGLMFVGFCV
jgi:hypothetical protein